MQKLCTDEEKKSSPYETASRLSFIFYSWLTPLIDLGAKRTLDFDDVYPTPASLSSNTVYDLFQTIWDKEQELSPGSGANNFGWMLLRCNIYPLVMSAANFIVYAVVCLLQPYFVVKILEYVTHGEVNFLGMTSGIQISVGLASISLIGILSFSVGFSLIQQVGYRIRNILILKIFNKSLSISNYVRNKHTTGEIVTLMSADTERYWLCALLSTWLWLSPAMIFVSLILIAIEFGLAAIVVTAVVGIWYQTFSKMSSWVGMYRSQIVKLTSERVKLMNEALQGIRVVKLYAWEIPTVERIEEIRQRESYLLMTFQLTKMFNTVLQFVTPTLISFTLFMSVYALGGSLSVAKVYQGLSLLNVMRLPLAILPIAYTSYKEAIKSHERVKTFLNSPEAYTLLLTEPTDKILVEIDNASFTWNELLSNDTANPLNASLVKDKDMDLHADAVLSDVNVQVRVGEFVALVGEVGSGKSSLISALLGQMTMLKGKQKLCAKVAYVSQESWIQNITLQENVLFNSPLDYSRYVDVLDASQLSQDLLTLPNADATEIGERGINLSGGQKARVNIARALYTPDVDLYIFDDPMAAVDVHVGKELFRHAFQEMLHDKARIISLSSNYQYLPKFDKIIVVSNGTISTCDSYADLIDRFPQFRCSDVNVQTSEMEPVNTVDNVRTENNFDDNLSFDDMSDSDDSFQDKAGDGIELTPYSQKKLSRGHQRGHSIYMQQRQSILLKQESGKSLTVEEDKESGSVSISTCANYFSYATSRARNPKFAGFCTLLSMFVLFSIAQTSRVYADVWPGLWAADQEKDLSRKNDQYWYTIYIVLLLVTLIFAYGRAIHLVVSCVWANIALHKSLIGKLFSAPVNTYFDITPLGRILNRFSKDLDMLDSILPDFFLQNVQNSFHIVAVLLMCALSSVYFAILVPFLCVVFYYYYNHFRKSSRELKRFDGITRSPVYSSFDEMLNGISTIRAYRRESYFFQQFSAVVDENFRHFFCFFQASRWLALRLDMVSNFIILFVSLMAVLVVDYGGSVDRNMLGMALVYSLQLMGMLQWTVRVTIETENNMTAAERLLAFNDIASEAERNLPTDPKIDAWPTRGHIVISNLSMRYRPGLEKVLNGVDIDIPGGCKVGICGRTGAGKSSLMLALFRIVEPEQGSKITLDGVDILALGLNTLRTQLTIIPQDPVMFSGSLRYNLDPFGNYSDMEIWEALDRSHLKDDVIQKFPEKLNHIVAERGENISVGQKQLLCIARALLRKPKVIIMDEATASVDSATDKKIQVTIRQVFKECTILTIAHRLETIADFDKIVVMNAGKVVEYASPHDLLQMPCGFFRGLVDQLGPDARSSFENVARLRKERNGTIE